MKANIASAIAIAMTLAPGLATMSMAATPQAPSAARTTQVAMGCPAGSHWEAAGYIHGGRWRAAHCANDQAPHY